MDWGEFERGELNRLLRKVLVACCCAALAACVTSRPRVVPAPWEQRLAELQHATSWQMDGRAAVALGTQGWQASLNWRQRASGSELHLSGPLGMGAVVLTKTADGLSLNGAPPSDAVLAQLQDKLGFELPLDDLRYWLLGVPNPGGALADLARNDQDRAQQLTQDGWTVNYDRYLPDGGDLLPGRLVMSRAGVRVRIAVDHWENPR
jgi:outer membrane lipoprotein LolB